MTIADRIQFLRKTAGISQEELAEKIGVSRQAISKWESAQSLPDIEKIVLLSEFFHVSTDYLLKGMEDKPETSGKTLDAQIFSLVATVLNFLGLILAIIIWKEEQTTFAIAIGLIFIAIGCMIHFIGQLIGRNKEIAYKRFFMVNIWIVSLIPISCIFNFLDGTFGGFWWTYTPLPQRGNSLVTYGLCWLFYIGLCFIIDVILLRKKTIITTR